MRAIAVATLLVATQAGASIPLVEHDDVRLTLGGYFRAFTAWQRPDLDAAAPETLPEDISLHATVARLELQLSALDLMALEVHSRLFWRLISDPVAQAGFGGTGAGVSTAPPRTVDLRSAIVEEDTHLLEHDLDRLVLRFFLGPVELGLGRQAITWGTSNLFAVADVWTTFSPFDLDTSQKRGVDALRLLWGVSMNAELDLVVVDRGTVDDLSGGVRATFYLPFGDVYVAAAKMWEELALFAGVSASVDVFKLRAEMAGIYDLDDEAIQLPRATVGIDWFATADLLVSLEGHFNGVGAAEPAGYLAKLQSEEVARGERYLVGRWYAGLLVNYRPHELLSLGLTGLLNAQDPSGMLAWRIAYDLAQDVDVSLGGFHGLGPGVVWSDFPALRLDGELGAYGHQVYLQLSAFF